LLIIKLESPFRLAETTNTSVPSEARAAGDKETITHTHKLSSIQNFGFIGYLLFDTLKSDTISMPRKS
jgi:hypothetical protein